MMFNNLIDMQKNYFSVAAEVAQIKSGAGLLFSIQVQNINAAVRYLYLFDALTSVNPMLVAPQAIGIGQTLTVIFDMPKKFSTGLRWNASSGAAGTFTTSAANDFIVTAAYL